MSTIGTVMRLPDGSYTGDFAFKSYSGKTLFRPTGATADKAPAFRIFGAGDHGGAFEMGAAWVRMRQDGTGTFVSVKLDYPELPAPIYATLGRMADQDDDDVFAVIWNRPGEISRGSSAADPFASQMAPATDRAGSDVDPLDAMAPVEQKPAKRVKPALVDNAVGDDA
jgi:uncharacterized protein (DUF736 family)